MFLRNFKYAVTLPILYLFSKVLKAEQLNK
jgi:hypothetical protein